MEGDFETRVYARKLNAQELGYRKGISGSAGRYFLISKGALNFFPPLSDIVINDNVLIDVIPPFSDDIVLTKYVYHNDGVASDGTRDEYRLYLNIDNDRERDYFKPDDIIVFVKINLLDKTIVYKLLRYSVGEKDYQKLNDLVEANALNPKKTHALIDFKDVVFLREMRTIKIDKKIVPQEIVEEVLKLPVVEAIVTEEDKYETTRVIRNRSFRDLVMYFYEDKCAITGRQLVIEHNLFCNLEAAHIFARASGGGSHPSNGIALERNLHWAFDKGFFTLTDDFKVEVHPEAMDIPYLKEINGKKIFLPEDSRSRPNSDSIKWHREHVFGIFMRTEA
jgi:hypothetical protein